MKGIAVPLIFLIILIVALPSVCGSLSTAAVSGSVAAENVKQKQIEQAQVETNLFDGADPDLAYGLREMRLANEHGNDTIARVAESADRSQTAIAYTLPVGLIAIAVAFVALAFIVMRLSGKQTAEVRK